MSTSTPLKSRLSGVLDQRTSRAGRYVQVFIQVLIILSVISFTVETLPDLDPTVLRYLHYFEVFVIAVFTVEYLLRLYLAKKKLKFVFSFFGIIDLLVILPFYLQLGLDLRSLRILWVLRLFRLFRLVKLARYGDALDRLERAFDTIRYDLAVFAMGASLVLYLASVGMYYLEKDAQPEIFGSVFHALWWALVTLTTVGYGDAYPITLGGRLFSFIVILVGLGVFAVPTALIVMALVNTAEEIVHEEKDAETNGNGEAPEREKVEQDQQE
jgi:voltage-gated potassium channel